ncbi:auxin-responsive protein SAUR32-like [Telopea speciosissima]|uniref:auxin-responsive protein SAUR32-like n=1 Tax=Telopea speciosissima TaxID=54955 RepID=UPI001CC34FCB|nr:auxin-responsive protein SAUR32-like [Telopea speciosissima]
MGKSRTLSRKKKGIVKLKFVIEKLQKSFSLSKRPASLTDHELEEMGNSSSVVPEDVKEGHFAVIAHDDGEPKRFVVALSYLTNPAFLRLLEQAAEEFGFNQEGALTIPCRSNELERILGEHWEREVNNSSSVLWMSCKTMVKSN